VNRREAEARYRELVSVELPAAAREQGWVITRDHCFGRVLLDDAVGACWYDVLGRGRGAAFRKLDDAQLAHAVAQGEWMLAEGAETVRALDAQSLAWRGKPPKASTRGHDLPT
jgi:hypothetical protein